MQKLEIECALVGKSADVVTQEIDGIQDIGQKINFVGDLLKSRNLCPKYEEFKQLKNKAKAALYRNQGNHCYRETKKMDALEYYNRR
jgi:hypothetical protein